MSWKSANLEGLGTTVPKTEAILANAPTTTKTEEVLFVINMKRALQFLFDNLDYNNCIMLLREYNKIVGELLFNYPDEIRTIPVQIGCTSWEPEMPQSGIIMDIIDELDRITDAEMKALKYFCFVAREQMFIEGNGRSARIWLYLILRKELGMVIDWRKVDKEDYLLAIERSPIKDVEIKLLLKNALTDKISDREVYMKGIIASYHYEGYNIYKVGELD